MQNGIINKGDILTAQFIGDSDLKPTFTVTERKGNFATLTIDGEVCRKKVYTDIDGTEYIYPYGKYNMAAIAKKR